MNKYIKIGLASVIGILSFNACDVMDTRPMESYDESLVWGSTETAESYVFGTYQDIINGLYAGKCADMEARTPNGVKSDLQSLDGFPTETSIDKYTDMGFNQFSRLRRCNLIIEKVAASTLPDGVKKQLTAEATFLRGLVFFFQARWMGRFVPITKLLSPDSTEEFKTPLTANVAASYEIVLKDLNDAVEGLPVTAFPGRATKYAALAFVSKAALQAYAYTKDAKYLDMCIAASKQVIGSSQYGLVSEYGDMFLAKGSTSKEIILGYYRLSQNTETTTYNELMLVGPNCSNDDIKQTNSGPAFKNPNGQSFGAWGVYFPTNDLVDQYLVIDEADNKAKPIYETSQYKKLVTEADPVTLPEGSFTSTATAGNKWNVPEKDDMGSNEKGSKIVRYGTIKPGNSVSALLYGKRDKRFYSTIVYDSCYWLNNEFVTTRCHGNIWAGSRPGAQSDSWYTTATGYYWRKGVYDVQPNLVVGVKTDYHFVIVRLGEMYMNLAEAYLLKGGANNIATAVGYLNETRVTHGGLNPSTATTEAEAWTDYMRERRVEMAYENDIYWSYLRWGKYGNYANNGKPENDVINDLNSPVHKIQITKDASRFFIGQVVRNGAWNRNFTVRRYLMPIPQGQLDKRAASGIKEDNNPGWF